MSGICHLCGRTMENVRMVIHDKYGPFTMICDECYMDADGYMEEMRGCGCGGDCH